MKESILDQAFDPTTNKTELHSPNISRIFNALDKKTNENISTEILEDTSSSNLYVLFDHV